MADSIKVETEVFARRYAALFSSPDCSSDEHVANIAAEVAKYYRPGLTIFTNGVISKFEVRPEHIHCCAGLTHLKNRSEAAHLIEKEMRKNISYGIGTCLILEDISKVEVYSPTSALCWISWTFRPAAGSDFEGRPWRFTNIYGYRAEPDNPSDAGWEFVLRDEEVNAMVAATGKTFTN